MVFKVTLRIEDSRHSLLPLNYHYPIASHIFRMMRESQRADSSILHTIGYGANRYKLFTFSDIDVSFVRKGDRMQLREETASLKVCFHLPETAQQFLKRLLNDSQMTIGDRKSWVHFKVQEVSSHLINLKARDGEMVSMMVKPISPIVVCSAREGKSHINWLYHSPDEKLFAERIKFNWMQKYRVVFAPTTEQFEAMDRKVKTELEFFSNPPIKRIMTIKEGTAEEHKIRGYKRFGVKLTAPKEMIELALNTGLGIKNSIGMGCVEPTHSALIALS